MRAPLPILSLGALALLTGTVALSTAQPARAIPSYATAWVGRYPASLTAANITAGLGQPCALCHANATGGSQWNPYGWKVREGIEAGQSALNAIINAENFNSDADPTGSTNLVEISSNSQPGWTSGANNVKYTTSGTTTGLLPLANITGNLDPSNGSPTDFCLGDGTGAACPCGNTGALGNGCGSASFAAGAHLTASGIPGTSSITDSLVLTATNLPGPALFIQASGLAGTPISFGDGQLCAAVGIIRLGIVFPTGSTAAYPGGLTPNPIHVAGVTSAGDLRHYQAWYRSLPGLCNELNYDLTQGVSVRFGP
jgi:hypothetical protein